MRSNTVSALRARIVQAENANFCWTEPTSAPNGGSPARRPGKQEIKGDSRRQLRAKPYVYAHVNYSFRKKKKLNRSEENEI